MFKEESDLSIHMSIELCFDEDGRKRVRLITRTDVIVFIPTEFDDVIFLSLVEKWEEERKVIYRGKKHEQS